MLFGHWISSWVENRLSISRGDEEVSLNVRRFHSKASCSGWWHGMERDHDHALCVSICTYLSVFRLGTREALSQQFISQETIRKCCFETDNTLIISSLAENVKFVLVVDLEEGLIINSTSHMQIYLWLVHGSEYVHIFTHDYWKYYTI